MTAEQAQATKEALATYITYREYVADAMRTGRYKREDLVKFVGEPKLGSQIRALASQKANGVTFTGRPTWSPRVSKVDLAVSPPIAVVTDCLDITNFIPQRDGKPMPGPSGPTRFVVIMNIKQVNRTWYVFEDISPQGQSC